MPFLYHRDTVAFLALGRPQYPIQVEDQAEYDALYAQGWREDPVEAADPSAISPADRESERLQQLEDADRDAAQAKIDQLLAEDAELARLIEEEAAARKAEPVK